jgi:hypothetical protein
MKKKIFLILLSVIISHPIFSQKWRGLSKLSKSAWNALEGALTIREVYNWVNDSRSTTSRYINPSGLWQSTTGKVFRIEATSYGMVFQPVNSYAPPLYCYSTNIVNFYQANREDAHWYYTVINENHIIINSCLGDEVHWRR